MLKAKKKYLNSQTTQSQTPHSQKGQMVIEMILVMTVLLAIMGALKSGLDNSEAFKTLVQGPWRVLSGMIVAGTWKSPEIAVQSHPALNSHHSSVKGSEP